MHKLPVQSITRREKCVDNLDMSFNPAKCQVLHVTGHYTSSQSTIFFHNTKVESMSAAVTMYYDLIYGKRIDNIRKK